MVRKFKHPNDIETDTVATIDLGGTVVKGEIQSSHQHILEKLGVPSYARQQVQNSAENFNGYKNYRKWESALNEAIEEYAKAHNYAETYLNAVEELVEDRTIIPGARDFVSYLNERGIDTIALSNEPVHIAEHLAEELGMTGVYQMAKYSCGKNSCKLELDENRSAGKNTVVRLLQDQGSEVMHFGNGKDDEWAVRRADAGIKQRSWIKQEESAYKWAKKSVENKEVLV